MKLKNKRTGEIGELHVTEKHCAVVVGNGTASCGLEIYSSLARLYEEWEDVLEEPKDNNYWYIDDFGRIQFSSEILDEVGERPNNWMARKLFGNYFGTREEAEKAVEKLKAWKRLKDKGFKFEGHSMLNYAPNDTYDYSPSIGFSIPELDKDEPYEYPEEIEKDLDICFGGEE